MQASLSFLCPYAARACVCIGLFVSSILCIVLRLVREDRDVRVFDNVHPSRIGDVGKLDEAIVQDVVG